MKFLIKVLLLVLAVSTFAATGVTRKRSHAKILTKKRFAQSFCKTFLETEKSKYDTLLTQCYDLERSRINVKEPKAIEGLCNSLIAVEQPISLDNIERRKERESICKDALKNDDVASNIQKGCVWSTDAVIKWVHKKCNGFKFRLRNKYY